MELTLYEYVVGGLLQIFVCIFGIICNSISVVVLTRPEMKSSPNVLLLGLALADNVYILGRILSAVRESIWSLEPNYRYKNLFELFLDTAAMGCIPLGELDSFIPILKLYARF
jgi:hypothetical protein